MSIKKVESGDPLSQSKDLVQENIQQLKALFPEIVTEGKIDFKVLQAILGEEIEESDEYYRFTWAGKAQARREAHKPSTGTLRPCKEESVDWETTQNLYIEGDNLEVLKLLQKSYAEQVKMIYIDPPYNTGKDFVYKDNYKDNLKNYQEITNYHNEDGHVRSTNSESDGRYHSNWLNMMYPRLKLARNLLKEDGVIFMSIDDNEVENLKKIGNEIFGEENFVAQFIHAGNSSKNNAKNISITHEYVLIFANKKDSINLNSVKKNNIDEFVKRVKKLQKLTSNTKEISKEIKELVKYPRFYDFDHYTYADSKGPFRANDLTAMNSKNFFDIIHPVSYKPCKTGRRGWAYNPEGIKKLLDEDKILFGEDENTVPQIKGYLYETLKQVPKSISFFDSQVDTKQLKKAGIPFDFPKSVGLIQLFLEMTTAENDIVLDFFSGSGSSANAILNDNIENEKKQKFIQVQLPESTDKKSEAYKAGYKTIAEIGKERIRRAAKKIAEENPLLAPKMDLGFKVFKLDSSNIQSWSGNPENLEQELFDAVDNIKTDRSEEDVLYEILLKYGLDLTLPIEEKAIAGKKVFNIGMGALFICLANNIDNEVAEGIGQWKAALDPAVCRVVFKDTGFKTDADKTNAMQNLKRFGITEVKSI